MTSHVSFPPHRFHSSHQIATSEALALLSTYLEAAVEDASLQPNALLTEQGPVSANAGSNIGLVLHNLQRVQAGLKGEHLGADLSFEEFSGEGKTAATAHNGAGGVDGVNGRGSARAVDFEGQGGDAQMGQAGWQDKEDFEREQEIEEGDVGRRSSAVVIEKLATRKKRTVMASEDYTQQNGVKDKEARKARKKAKRLQERRDKEAAKREAQD